MSIRRALYCVKHSRSSARDSAVPTRDGPGAGPARVGELSGGFSGIGRAFRAILAGCAPFGVAQPR